MIDLLGENHTVSFILHLIENGMKCKNFYCEEANNFKLHSMENVVYPAAESHKSKF